MAKFALSSEVNRFVALIGILVLGSRLVAPLFKEPAQLVLCGLGQPTGVHYSHREE